MVGEFARRDRQDGAVGVGQAVAADPPGGDPGDRTAVACPYDQPVP